MWYYWLSSRSAQPSPVVHPAVPASTSSASSRPRPTVEELRRRREEMLRAIVQQRLQERQQNELGQFSTSSQQGLASTTDNLTSTSSGIDFNSLYTEEELNELKARKEAMLKQLQKDYAPEEIEELQRRREEMLKALSGPDQPSEPKNIDNELNP